jgi:Fur family ferric uptake transcriptional regulator
VDKKERFTRMTNQRLLLLEHLQESKKHLTIDQLYSAVKPQLPKLSKATVYRNINLLEEEGLVQSLDIGKKEKLYEVASEPHHHFVCDNCNRIIEVNLADIWQIKERIERKYGVKVDSYQLIAKGKCDFCQRH